MSLLAWPLAGLAGAGSTGLGLWVEATLMCIDLPSSSGGRSTTPLFTLDAAVLDMAVDALDQLWVMTGNELLLVDAASGRTFERISPIDGRVIAKIARGEAADVDAAVASARAAFERGDWRRTDPKERKRVLLRFAELIRGG